MPSPLVPVWARQLHKFVIERIGIDLLHLGLLLLMLISLLILFLSLTSIFRRFCCGTSLHPTHRRKHSAAAATTVPIRTSNGAGFFTGTNEERRCLLQPNGICTDAQQQGTKTSAAVATNGGQGEEGEGRAVTGTAAAGVDAAAQRQQENATIVVDSVTQPKCLSSSTTPLMALRGQLMPLWPVQLSGESPPPPRRFATGGRTQVLPLTAQNCRRVPPLVMLMADQQQQQQNRQQQPTRGRVGTTQDNSRTTTATTTTTASGTVKNCATIPEDPEEGSRPMADELLSIDRTFVSVGDEQPQQQQVHGVAHRLPLQHQPPQFEVQPPSYSPPEPPSKTLAIHFCHESNIFSSYGAQTPLNTTTGSSADPSVDSILGNRNAEVRISELDSEVNVDRVCWANAIELGSAHTVTLSQRVPRSISQQLELMNMTQP